MIKELKAGRVLSFNDTAAYVRSEQLDVSMQELRALRRNILETAVFRNAYQPRFYQGIQIHQLGLVQIDVAFYKEKQRHSNSNYIGWIQAVAPSTGVNACIPVRNKNTETFENAIAELLDAGGPFPVLHTIQSDRERTLVSAKFRQLMFDRHQIRLHTLVKGSKAWSSERAIRNIKTKLSTVMKAKTPSKRWVDHLQSVVTHHNSQLAFGTKFKRTDIDQYNFMEYLSKRFGVKDLSMSYNTASMNSTELPDSWNRKLFAHLPGDRVLISQTADYTYKGSKTFMKKSTVGTWSDVIYLVTRAALRNTLNADLVPGDGRLFELRSLGGVNHLFCFFAVFKVKKKSSGKELMGWFYGSEIAPAPPGEHDEEEEEEEVAEEEEQPARPVKTPKEKKVRKVPKKRGQGWTKKKKKKRPVPEE